MRSVTFVLLLCLVATASAIDVRKKKHRTSTYKRVEVNKAKLMSEAKSPADWFKSLMKSDFQNFKSFTDKEKCVPSADTCCKKKSVQLTDIKVDGLKLGFLERKTEGKAFEFVLDIDLERSGGSWNDPCEIPDDCETSLYTKMPCGEEGECSADKASTGQCTVPFNWADDQGNPLSALTFTDFDDGLIFSRLKKVAEMEMRVEVREEDPIFDDEMGFATIEGSALAAACKTGGRASFPLSKVSVKNLMKNAGKALAKVGSQVAKAATGAIGGAFAGASGNEAGCKKAIEVADELTFNPSWSPTKVDSGATISFNIKCCGFDD